MDCRDAVENQNERFAPGIRERILAKHTFTAQHLAFPPIPPRQKTFSCADQQHLPEEVFMTCVAILLRSRF
jgi:hypothetical protein